jgi:PadR family transcriptional regulator PadR
MARELAKGDIPVLILTVLAQGASHGYAIAREIERQSDCGLTLREGSLYPALRVLEQDGFVESDWEIQASGPARKVYRITEAGQAELAQRTQMWKQYADMINRILGDKSHAQTT